MQTLAKQTLAKKWNEVYKAHRDIFNKNPKMGNAYDIIRFNPHANVLWDGNCYTTIDFLSQLTKKEKRQLKASQVAHIKEWVFDDVHNRDIEVLRYIVDTIRDVRLEIIPQYHY